MAFDPNLFVCDFVQHVADLLQHFDAGRFHLGLTGIEQDTIDHVDGEAVAHLLNRNVSLRNFVLERLGQFFLCASQPFDLFFFRQPFLLESSLVCFFGFQP